MNRWIMAMMGWLCISNSSFAVPQPSAQENLLQDQKYLQSVYRFLIAEVAKQRGQPALAIPLYSQLLKDYPDAQLARQGVETAIRAGRLGNALDFASTWNMLDSKDQTAQDWLISLIFKSNNPNAHRAQLEKILTDNPDKQNAIWLTLAARASDATQKESSAALIDDMANAYPKLAEAWWAKAFAAEVRGNEAEVSQYLKQALTINPDWEPAAIQNARLQGKDNLKAGIRELEKFVASHPQAGDAKLALARLLVTDRQFDKALTAFEAAQSLKPDNPDISYAIGILALQAGDTKKAESTLLKALDQSYPDEDAVYLLLGEIAEKKQQLEAAINYYQMIDGSSFAAAQLRIADLLDEHKEFNRGIDLLDQAIERQPAMAAQFGEAKLIMLRHAKRFDDAYALLTEKIAKEPSNPNLYYERAMIADQQGKLELLEKDLQQALKLDPAHAKSLNALGYTMADQLGKAAEGLPLIEKAISADPENPAYIDSLGWAQYRLGQLDAAEANLRKAYLMEDDAEIAAHLGEVLWTRGKQDEAKKIWNAAKQKAPERTEIDETLKKLQVK